MDEYRQHVAGQVPPIAIEFFAAFSRIEFALKRGGFVLGAIGRTATPDWNDFAATLGPAFYDAMSHAPAARILFDDPPRVLQRIDGPKYVDFRPPPRTRNGQLLFEAIRRVRNNLFHGEKAFLRDRDHDLIAACLFVLDSAMTVCMHIERCRPIAAAFAFAEVAPA